MDRIRLFEAIKKINNHDSLLLVCDVCNVFCGSVQPNVRSEPLEAMVVSIRSGQPSPSTPITRSESSNC